ncbi:hypothetical protein LX36DRAFT_473658 [Colletotrichum falcatum]|nr:hypothetical protein LX36DRAFT_473658 [Colletotrichum falcatum]
MSVTVASLLGQTQLYRVGGLARSLCPFLLTQPWKARGDWYQDHTYHSRLGLYLLYAVRDTALQRWQGAQGKGVKEGGGGFGISDSVSRTASRKTNTENGGAVDGVFSDRNPSHLISSVVVRSSEHRHLALSTRTWVSQAAPYLTRHSPTRMSQSADGPQD